jgi:protein-disulfide isomerase
LGTIVLTTIGHAALLQGEVPKIADVKPGYLTGGATFVLALIGLGFSVVGLEKQIDVSTIGLNQEVGMKEAQPIPAKMTPAPNAKIVLLEFADFNCPSCRSNYPEVKRALQKYGTDVRMAFRHLPLFDKPGHETSLDAAILAELAADKGLYWEYIDTLFAPENKERIKDKEGLIGAAIDAGLERAEILAIYEKGEDGSPPKVDEYIERVEEDIRLAAKLGVTMTPTYIVYAEGVEPRVLRPTGIQAVLDEEPYRSLMK